MNASDLLNADMATLARLGRRGFDWWLAELTAMLPPALRRGRRRGPEIAWDGVALGSLATGGDRAAVRIAPGLALTRRIMLADLPDGELQRALHAEADRLLPLPAVSLVVAACPLARDRTAGTVEVALAALPLGQAEALAAAIAADGIAPAQILIADASGTPAVDIDFLGDFRARQLLPPGSRAPAIWWAIVAFLVVLNIAILIWRDQATVDALQGLVDAQRPAVAATRRVEARITARDAEAARAVAQRSDRNPLAMLAQLSRDLPESVFLLKLSWDGDALRLSGYKPRASNIVAALRSNPRLSEVKAVRNEGLAEIPAGQPFDVAARVRPEIAVAAAPAAPGSGR